MPPDIGGYINDVALQRPGIAERHAKAVAEFALRKAQEPSIAHEPLVDGDEPPF